MDIKLRLFREDDFEACHAMISNYDVVKMTATWPYPADLDFTRMRMNSDEVKSGLVNVIDVDGEFAGTIGAGTIGNVNGGRGYMLSPAFWGKGVMTRAVDLKLMQVFANADVADLGACVWHDNPASSRVLEKVGFRLAYECAEFCKARNEKLSAFHYKLSREDWEARVGGL